MRRSEFPDRPSRLQSVFAVPTVEDAVRWRSSFDVDDEEPSPIWEIEFRRAFRADASLLDRGSTALVTAFRAHVYWAGSSFADAVDGVWEVDDPQWELLIEEEALVLARAD